MASDLIISQMKDPADLTELAADAAAEGRPMVSRLLTEWTDGTNRFNLAGERVYVATLDGRIVAVCGLNLDPFANDPTTARIRRLYVAVTARRRGLGSAIISKLSADAKDFFVMLHLRTHDTIASAFYESIGFIRTENILNCTHRRRVIG